MASPQNLRRRAKGEPSINNNNNNNNNNDNKGRRGGEQEGWRLIIVWVPLVTILKYIIRSIWVVGGAPASLHVADALFIRSARRASAKPHWMEGLTWVTDALFVVSSLVMNHSLYAAWVQCGIPKDSVTRVAGCYLVHVILNLAWDPIVFGWGAKEVGLYTSFVSTLLAGAIGSFVQDSSILARAAILNFCGGFTFLVFGINMMLFFE